MYYKVNVEGTKNVYEACKACGVSKLVMSSSPSTRMTGEDLDGVFEKDMPSFEQMQGKFTQTYAETKFIGEKFVREKCSDELLTIAVAPHQVYGPRDTLFLPNLLEVAGSGKLRVFSKKATGYGKVRISMTYVDNYCHGLMLAAHALTPESDCKGKFYMITDGKLHPHTEGYVYFWDILDEMIIKLGFDSIKKKTALPYWFLMPLATLLHFGMTMVGSVSKLSPFTVTMLTMHRWFKIDAAEEDLGYQPLVSFEDGWKDTEDWFRTNWLPEYKTRKTSSHIFSKAATSTTNKINLQKRDIKKNK